MVRNHSFEELWQGWNVKRRIGGDFEDALRDREVAGSHEVEEKTLLGQQDPEFPSDYY